MTFILLQGCMLKTFDYLKTKFSRCQAFNMSQLILLYFPLCHSLLIGLHLLKFECGYFSDFSWSKKLEEVQTSVFRIQKLRLLQLEAMNATMSNQDCMVVMPTGGGKSLCFQLPALLHCGRVLVPSEKSLNLLIIGLLLG